MQVGQYESTPFPHSKRSSSAWYTLWGMCPAACTRGRRGIIGGASPELPTTTLDQRTGCRGDDSSGSDGCVWGGKRSLASLLPPLWCGVGFFLHSFPSLSIRTFSITYCIIFWKCFLYECPVYERCVGYIISRLIRTTRGFALRPLPTSLSHPHLLE